MEYTDVLNTANKVFDSLPEEEKKEVFLNTIESIENNQNFQKLKKYRDELDEDKKLQYYNKWEIISVKWSIKYSTRPWIKPIKPLLNPLNIGSMVKENMKEEAYETASPLMRVWVSFWLLNPPKKLEEKKLLKNIEKDARRLRRNLWIFEKVCYIVPQLKAAAPIVKALKPYAKWYEKEWASLMQERIRQNLSKETAKDVASVLSSVEEDIVKTEVQETKD